MEELNKPPNDFSKVQKAARRIMDEGEGARQMDVFIRNTLSLSPLMYSTAQWSTLRDSVRTRRLTVGEGARQMDVFIRKVFLLGDDGESSRPY
jgi:hypothetical protein